MDLHANLPPQYLEVMEGHAAWPEIRGWTLAKSLEEMDRHGVTTVILSLSPPGIHRVTPERMRRLARTINEHAAKIRGDHPSRLSHFASVLMPDVDGTLAEIAYALDTLRADGIELMTSYGKHWPGEPQFEPVFAELNRCKALVFIHSLGPDCCAGLIDLVPPGLTEFPQDTTRCVFSLLFSGTLARFPEIRFIFCNAGDAVPVWAGRAQLMGLERRSAQHVPHGIDHELRRLHYDVALAANRPALAALFAYVPTEQVLLGSDYPFGTSRDGIRGLEDFGLAPAALDAIYRGNARRLIPHLAV